MADIPVSPGGTIGGQVTGPGQLQFGDMLLGGGTAAGWRELVGWRDTPGAQVSDSPRPQAHGAYPGDVFGDSLVVTYTYLLRGTPGEKVSHVDTIERYAPMDGVERPLTVNDGAGPWFRMARVIGRQVPQDHNFEHGPLECSLQFLCADPRRYARVEKSATVTLPASLGGLEYPLDYPLGYGESSSGALSATNAGSVPTPVVATFHGPLEDPVLTTGTWTMAFNINLVDGETLTVDTNQGTAMLNGNADRLYTLRNDSSPLERCFLPPGDTNLALLASSAGDGRLVVTYRDARM